ncbi:hypothetical protein SAMN05518672_106175 [Chitinophaga sp. CF118]|uniref:hypothetical protein n=1 Tax=Chitinophaga sp. CF118 TaxID=1884367 RepID=UPI0008DF19DA|nr:hypothetical protein [Chitinophaga sp. CF118]SFE45309.1 hypothetical protein SAMN05518672_106175 [Chitinophaga sp. CF118]
MLQLPLVQFLRSDAGEIIKLIGILSTVLISIIVLIITVKSFRSRTYTNQITSLKAKYIEDLRQHLAEYLSLALECNKAIFNEKYRSMSEKHQLLKDLDHKYALITLFLNNRNPIDRKLYDYIQEIRLAAITQKGNGWKIEDTIQQLVNYGQQVLLLEWKNLKKDARYGSIRQYKINNIKEDFVASTIDNHN